MSVNFKDNSKQVLSMFDKATDKALKAIGMTAEGYAKKDTPVDTGRLRNSISHAETNKATYIGSNVEYAPFIELGARGRKPYHMIKRAATEHTDEYKQLAKQAFENG